MAKTNADLAGKIASKNPERFTQLNVQNQLNQWKDTHFSKLAALASNNQDQAEKLFVVCMNTIAKNPALLTCTFDSVANCILQSFQLNLFPGAFQECSYVPLRNGKASERAGKDITEANFWPQYQGLVKLMRNAGNKYIVSRVVCENDLFQYKEGSEAPVYTPAVVLGKKRGKALFVYCAVLTPQGGWQVEVMDEEQVMTIKSRSQGAKKSDSPWNSKHIDDQHSMWAKTCLKRISKWCAKSPELVQAIESDNEVDGDPALLRSSVFGTLDLIGDDGAPVVIEEVTNISSNTSTLTQEPEQHGTLPQQ